MSVRCREGKMYNTVPVKKNIILSLAYTRWPFGMSDGNHDTMIGSFLKSESDDVFKHPWVGASFYGNPEYTAEFIT